MRFSHVVGKKFRLFVMLVACRSDETANCCPIILSHGSRILPLRTGSGPCWDGAHQRPLVSSNSTCLVARSPDTAHTCRRSNRRGLRSVLGVLRQGQSTLVSTVCREDFRETNLVSLVVSPYIILLPRVLLLICFWYVFPCLHAAQHVKRL